MVADRVIIVLLVVSCLLVAGCVDSMQTVRTPEKNVSGPDNATSSTVPEGGTLQLPGMQLSTVRQAPDERLPPPTPDTRQAYEPLVGPYGDLSRTGITQQDPGSTESTTGSSSGSSGSSSLPPAAADAGLAAPMPASGVGSLTEPGQNNLQLPGTGSAGTPPGEYYEGAGAVITPYPTRDSNSCGCAM
jgi:hypothetical protein